MTETAAHTDDTAEQPAGDAAFHRFEVASYTQLSTGDRVKAAQVYNGALIGWWWPILTVDHVDWGRDDHTALMRRLAEPMANGDRFALIAGRARVDAGVRRIIEATGPNA
jgi:hypothetical protein